MRRFYLALVFVAVVAGTLMGLIALQHVVSNIAKPDVISDDAPGKRNSN